MRTNTKKKILFVIDSLSSGGAEKSLITALSIINKEKYAIDLLTFKKGGLYSALIPNEIISLSSPNYFNYLSNDKKNISNFKKAKYLFFKYSFSTTLRLQKLTAKIFPKYRIHPAQLNWVFIKPCLDSLTKEYDSAIAYSQGLPTYFVANKVNSKNKFCWINTNYKQANYTPKFDLPHYLKFNKIITVSEINSKIFKQLQPSVSQKVTVIYDILCSDIIKKMANESKGFTDHFNGLKILTIARLAAPKGHKMAIEAAAIIKNKNIKFKWFAIGDGALLLELKKLVKKYKLENHFIFLGTHANPYTFLKECDIYCQPSLFEGFGLAIAEARILSKPIVATNFEIVHNQITNKHNGLIVDMNPNAIADGIEELIKNKELKQKIISNLKKEVISNEFEIKKIEELLDS